MARTFQGRIRSYPKNPGKKILKVLFDTTILIDDLRGKDAAADCIESLGAKPLISTLTVLEIYAGARPKEIEYIGEYLSTFVSVPVDEEIARQAGVYFQQYHKSHNTGLADAIIAATCKVKGLTLVTLSKKHFPMLPGLTVPY